MFISEINPTPTPTSPLPRSGDPGSPQEDAGEVVGLNFKAAQSSEKQHCMDQQQIKSDQVNPGEGGLDSPPSAGFAPFLKICKRDDSDG